MIEHQGHMSGFSGEAVADPVRTAIVAQEVSVVVRSVETYDGGGHRSKIGQADGGLGAFTSLLNGREKQGGQNGDDGDDHEKLDEGKTEEF